MDDFSEKFERPIVLSAEETARREAAKQQSKEQNSQPDTILKVDGQTIELDVAKSELSSGDVLVEGSTALDMFISTDKKSYEIEDPNFKNEITGETQVLVKETPVSEAQDGGMGMFFN